MSFLNINLFKKKNRSDFLFSFCRRIQSRQNSRNKKILIAHVRRTSKPERTKKK